ncbi:protein of unknown function [Hyphomicrobium sp. 1Nfss2.1]
MTPLRGDRWEGATFDAHMEYYCRPFCKEFRGLFLQELRNSLHCRNVLPIAASFIAAR